MYGFPTELDFSPMVGESTTQICVGPFDVQFAIGRFRFIVSSPIEVFRESTLVGEWDGASWPAPVFYDLMNVVVTSVEKRDSRALEIGFENGLRAVLKDDSDQYESIQIVIDDNRSAPYII